MTRKEAINIIKSATVYTPEEMEALETLIPELRESEDERIRKFICSIIDNLEPKDFVGVKKMNVLAWLEKQKDLDKMIVVSPEVWDEAIADAYENGKKDNERQKEPEHDATDAKSERVIKAARSVLNNWLDGTNCPDVSGDFTELEYAIREYDGEEKQKEPENTSASVMIPSCWEEKQKENSKSADSISSDCTSNAKCEDRWHNVKDSLPDSTREVLCKDAIGNYFIGRYYSKGVWEVSMYDDCDKSNEDNPPVVMWIDIPAEKQKEQKPEENCTLEFEKAKAKYEGIVEGKQTVIDNPEEYSLCEQVEWSEEDEKTISDACCWIAEYAGYLMDKNYGKASMLMGLTERLKSLRPQSKDEIYKEKDKAYKLGKHHLAVKFINYLDENRTERKMSLSNGECEDIDKAFKEGDWAKIMRYYEKYRSSWKPSEKDIKMLEHIIGQYETGNKNSKVMGYLPRVEELSFLKNVLSKWKN